MNEQNIIEEPWRGIATYSDYEDADSERVAEMQAAIRRAGGDVIKTIANEEDGEAQISFKLTDDGYSGDKVQTFADENGWEVRWL